MTESMGRGSALPPGTVDARTGRFSAGLVCLALAATAIAAPRWLGLAAAVFLVDYGGRCFTCTLGSPITWVSGLLLDMLHVPAAPVARMPMRWATAVGAVIFSFVLALVEGGFMLPARALAMLAVVATGAFAFFGFCTVGRIVEAIARRAEQSRARAGPRGASGRHDGL